MTYVCRQVAPGYENIFMFHNSWFSYAATMRIFKHYHLNVRDSATGASSMSFSSYPGISFFYVSSQHNYREHARSAKRRYLIYS